MSTFFFLWDQIVNIELYIYTLYEYNIQVRFTLHNNKWANIHGTSPNRVCSMILQYRFPFCWKHNAMCNDLYPQ